MVIAKILIYCLSLVVFIVCIPNMDRARDRVMGSRWVSSFVCVCGCALRYPDSNFGCADLDFKLFRGCIIVCDKRQLLLTWPILLDWSYHCCKHCWVSIIRGTARFVLKLSSILFEVIIYNIFHMDNRVYAWGVSQPYMLGYPRPRRVKIITYLALYSYLAMRTTYSFSHMC